MTAWQGLEHVGWMNDAGAFLWLGHPSVTEEAIAKWLRPVFAPKKKCVEGLAHTQSPYYSEP